MARTCVDWNANPPIRKTPLLILKCDDDRVYTMVPKEFKTLEEVARREFNLGDVNLKLSSGCANLCDGMPARISEAVWEHASPYIGCIIVEATGPRSVEGQPPQGVSYEEQPTESNKTKDKRMLSAKRQPSSDTGDGDENEKSDHGHDVKLDPLASETVRDEQSSLSDHGNGPDGASVPGAYSEEEEVSIILPKKSRKRRHVVAEDENENEESEGDRGLLARSQVPPVTSPVSTQPSKEAKKRDSGYRSQLDSQTAEPLQPNKAIKQEKHESGSGSGSRSYPRHGVYSQPPHPESQYDAHVHARMESNEKQKLMIRIAHRASKQESKFTAKSTTKVAKVLAGACQSFGLDASRANMYLIVSTNDENGEEENLFPCDKNDSIARAGAEHDTESRFLLKIVGEA